VCRLQIGTRVRVYIKNVPKAVYSKQNPLIPFFLFGLFEHEHKQSVLNFVVQRNTEYDEPVKSKVRRLSLSCPNPKPFSSLVRY
jgi:pre-rRNA-processing protein TSR1